MLWYLYGITILLFVERFNKSLAVCCGRVSFLFTGMVILILTVIVETSLIPNILLHFLICNIAEAGNSSWSIIDSIIALVSGCATVLLGVLTLRQTHLINQKERRAQLADIKRPYFALENIVINRKDKYQNVLPSEDGYMIHLSCGENAIIVIKNYGDGIAADLRYKSVSGFGDYRDKEIVSVVKPEDQKSIFFSPVGNEEGKIILNYANAVGARYEQEIPYSCTFISYDREPVSDRYEDHLPNPVEYYEITFGEISTQKEI